MQLDVAAQLLEFGLQLLEPGGHLDQRTAVEKPLDARQATLDGGGPYGRRRAPTRADHRRQRLLAGTLDAAGAGPPPWSSR